MTTDSTVTGNESDAGSTGVTSTGGEETTSSGSCGENECLSGSCRPSLESDPEHCGACGVVCLSGACSSGFCEPSALGFVGDLQLLAGAGDFVFAASGDGSVLRFREDESPEQIIPPGPTISALFGDPAALYTYAEGMLMRRDQDGVVEGNIFVEPDASISLGPRGFLAANGRVYWTQRWGETADVDEHLVSVDETGGDYQVHGLLPYSISPLAVSGGQLLFVGEDDDGDVLGSGDAVGQFSISILASGRDARRRDSRDGFIWFLEPFGGGTSVARIGLGGGRVETVASVAEPIGLGAGGIAATADSVFWSSSGQLYGCKARGCEPVTIGSGAVDGSVVAAGDWVYWAEGPELLGIRVQ